MKTNIRRKIYLSSLIASVLLLSLLLSACSGFSTSFLLPIRHDPNKGSGGINLACDIISDRNVFAINEVTLEYSFGFYTGGSHDPCPQIIEKDGSVYDLVSFISYFQYSSADANWEWNDGKDGVIMGGVVIVDNYYGLSNTVVFKEIKQEDFYTDMYTVTLWGRTNRTLDYSHNEIIVVPSLVFNGDKNNNSGVLLIVLSAIFYCKTNNKYIMKHGAHIGMKYELLKNGKVKLSL